jgi:hypothetical protein
MGRALGQAELLRVRVSCQVCLLYGSESRSNLLSDDIQQIEVIVVQMLEHDPLHSRLGQPSKAVDSLVRCADDPADG